MRGGKNTQGYTIVEVMIFLAISGVMFVMAASFISGKQARSEFKQGMNDINSQVQQTISDVSNGFYPTSGNFICNGTSGGPTFVGGGPGSEQGGKLGCTFMGKILQFGATGDQQYSVYVISGLQFKNASTTDLTPPTTFAEAFPKVTPGLTQTNSLQWGIQLDKIVDKNDPGNHPGAVGIFSGFGGVSDGRLESGAAATIAVVIPNSQQGTFPDATVNTHLNDLSTATLSNPNIILCFSGGANQFGRLNIGSSDAAKSQRLSTSIQITSGAPSPDCAATP